jgi:uncharacterized protein YjbI with pentapeptide repeats
MEILTAFVRENASNKNISPSDVQNVSQESSARNLAHSKKSVDEDSKNAPTKPATDIQAVLTVISRRLRTFENGEDQRLDLSNTNLSRINLYKVNLSGAFLSEANLLNCTYLTWAQIDSTYIDENTELPPQLETQKQEKLKRLREKKQNPAQ